MVSTLQKYEHYVNGSRFPIYLCGDHKPILYLKGRKRQLSNRFFKNQVNITKFHNLKLIWIPASNLALAEILSKSMTISEANRLQFQHKEIPQHISFYDQDGHKIHYTIKHEDDQDASHSNFHLISIEKDKATKTLSFKNSGNEHLVEDYHEDNENLAANQNKTDFFELGKTIYQYKKTLLQHQPCIQYPLS